MKVVEEVLLFPGQGALVSEATHRDLLAQMAVFAESMLAWRLWQERNPRQVPQAVAGHSMGIYAALVAAGVVEEEQAMNLLRTVDDLATETLGSERFAMGYVIGFLRSEVETLCRMFDGEVFVACVNTQRQMVVSGYRTAVEGVLSAALGQGAIAAALLPISKPFHTRFFEPVSRRFENSTRLLQFHPPKCPVLNVMSGEFCRSSDDIRAYLRQFLHFTQDWDGGMRFCTAQGFRRFREIGPGETLSRMLRWISRSAEALKS